MVMWQVLPFPISDRPIGEVAHRFSVLCLLPLRWSSGLSVGPADRKVSSQISTASNQNVEIGIRS